MKQRLLKHLSILVILVFFGLAGCQSGETEAMRAGQVTATRTPFQVASSTAAVTDPTAGAAATSPATVAAPTIAAPTAAVATTLAPSNAADTPTSAAATASTQNSAFPTALAQCIDQAGRIEEKEITFNPGDVPFNFRVYLPPCFDYGAGAPYPTLYMIHGQTFSDDQWPRLGIGEAADALIARQNAPPFLIIMPREPDTFADIYQSTFSGDVADGLVRWIDSQYPTCAQRECRAIGGLSRGGAWAVYLGFTRWELFGAIGAHSTPPFNTTPRDFSGWVKQIPAGSMPQVYMDIGRSDPYLSMASALEDQMVALGVPHDWYLFNGTHEEAYWSAHVADYLAWYTQHWPNPSSSE